jgi:hypothetical protein
VRRGGATIEDEDVTVERLGKRCAALAVGLLAMALPACGGDDADERGDDEESPGTTVSVDEATTTSLTPVTGATADELGAVYRDYWAMYTRLLGAPDPEDPEIDERTTGIARDDLVEVFTAMAAEGLVVRFEDRSGFDVVSVGEDADGAVVRACEVIDASVIQGDEEEDLDVVARLLDARLAEDDGSWVVAEVLDLDAWPGATECEA